MNVMFKDRDLFYEILKGKPHLIRKKPFQFFAQVVLSAIVMPLACIEFAISGMIDKGVQKQFIFANVKKERQYSATAIYSLK
jgi:hypothetical protein